VRKDAISMMSLNGLFASLATKIQIQFLKTAHKLGIPVVETKLFPEESTAMADEGNFGCATEHAIW